MSKQLSNISDEADERTNTPGVMTPIVEWQPEDGLAWVIENAVNRGTGMGIPVFGEFRDSNDDPLPQDTDMVLQFESPTDDQPYAVSEEIDSLRSYQTLDIRDQQNEEYIDAIKHILKNNYLGVEDNDKLFLSIRSTAEIDWANSRVTIFEQAVEEV